MKKQKVQLGGFNRSKALMFLFAVVAMAFLLFAVSCSVPGNRSTYETESIKSQNTLGGEIVVKKADDQNVCYIVPTPELKAKLSPEQYKVLVESGTEPPFQNAFWNNHEAGIYVDAIDGSPLFTSLEKYDSGTGWPSFWNPVSLDKVEFVEDLAYGMRRVEIRSKSSGGHLGHVFEDGPKPTGMRYCINSASLRFIPLADLEKEGYAEFIARF